MNDRLDLKPLSATKQELLQLLWEEQNALPLSFAQQRLWFLDQWEPGSPLYNISAAVRLIGTLNVPALEQSLGEIVQRHEALRTTFGVIGGQPVQVITSAGYFSLPITDLQILPKAEREVRAYQLVMTEVQRPFDLTKGPLLRTRLVRLAETEHILLLLMHHIISDAWSLGVLMRELVALYTTFLSGRPSPLIALPIQYADFAIWQRAWLQGDILEKQLAYWRQQLRGLPPVLELPTDRPRPATQTYRGAQLPLSWSSTLTRALLDLSRQEGATLFMTLLAAFKVLLQRYTGQTDILIGSPIANRNRREIEGLIGFFVNTLVLRTDLAGNPTFRELLGRVRQVALGAYAHQDLPFEKIVEEFDPRRNLSHAPIFQVMFALQNAPLPAIQLPGLALSLMEIDNGTAKFDLVLDLTETPEGLRGRFEYNTDLFETATIAEMASHLQTLLESIVAAPDQRLADLPILTETEQQHLLVELNDTQAEYRRDACVPELFEAQAAQTPDAIALVCEDLHLSYQELNHRANQTAHYLRTLGVRPEVVAGICLERSPEMVIGMLGILKAGGAYVPLDPTYPAERLRFILEDTHAAVLLTQRQFLDQVAGDHLHTLCLDSDWPHIAEQSAANLPIELTPQNLAYVIYTSGSTGKPKGVQVEQRGLLNLIAWQQRSFTVSRTDRTSLIAGVSFDASVWELWPYLCAGASLCIPDEETRTAPAQLRDWLVERAITLSFLPTPLAEAALSLDWPRHLALRTLLTGGEQLGRYPSPDLPFELVNNYGPTEGTVVTTSGVVARAGAKGLTPSVGRPIANVQVYLLDQYLQPVPAHVPGELYIGGDNLARGYWDQPDLTANRFIPNPFSREPGARLYRTGDLAHYLANGEIEFLGRVDHQVKIRGFRVELGEVEAVLRQHPAVRETVVVARKDISSEQRLIAYIVDHQQDIPGDSGTPDENSPLTTKELRDYLRSRLPAYMLPAAFVMLAELPLTPNGKVDRQALPAPVSHSPELTNTFIAPRTALEEIQANLWAQVLGVERVGLHDNFLELGGHSLLAVQLITRLRETFQVELSLRSLFEFPTVAELGEQIKLALESEEGSRIPPIERVSREGKLPLSFAQQRLWFLDQLEPGNPAYNIPAAIQLTGPLNVAVLQQSLAEIIRRHESLRTSFAISEGQPVQVITAAEEAARDWRVPVIDLQALPSWEQAAAVQQQIRTEAGRPFNLAGEPLIRMRLLKLAQEEHVLLLTMHHIISDGWSMGVLVQEVGQLYRAFADGRPSPLPAFPIQYADFASWQRQWLRDQVLKKQLIYWKKQLEGSLPALDLPTDHVRPAIQSFRGARHVVHFSATLLQQLRQLSQRGEATLFMTLLAAFKALLFRYTGQPDLIVGVPVANRQWAEVEGLIGFFVNMLVLRTDLSGNPSFRELLGRVRQVALGAYAHPDLPFEKLVEELQPQRDLSRSPLFQVMFALQDASWQTIDLPGLKLNLLPVERGAAQFDLSLQLLESAAGLEVAFEYNTDLFEKETIARLAGHYQTLLEGIAADPEQPVAQLPLLTQAEQTQLLKWNETQVDYPQVQSLSQLVEDQVQHTPEAVAVIQAEQQLTYHELNRRANQVAHYLREQGITPNTLVGVFMERSLELVIALLGILKAGGAYVPLDPEYPRERLAFMLKDAGVSSVLTQARLLSQLPEYEGQTICLDSDWEKMMEQSGANPIGRALSDSPPGSRGRPGEVLADDLAYVIYTSGSTGRPKGAMNTQRGICNRLLWMQDEYHLTESDRVLQKTPYSFDVSVWEFFWPLLTGACLVMAAPGGHRDPAYLIKVIAEQKITTLHFVPSMLQVFLEAREMEACASLRQVMCSGEALSAELQERFFTRLGARLHNLYGPTEAAIDVTYWACARDSQLRLVPIGRPIANTQLYILNSSWQPVPIGVPGELYIGGIGLARGYLNRPDLTAERFIPNPFLKDEGGRRKDEKEDGAFILHLASCRLYKTGDLARYLPQGEIEFLGRIDHQVKIRGFRIELGEVEAVLSRHPALREVVVVVREDIPGDKRLVAYLVPRQDSVPPVSELNNFLKEQLPEYMVPSALVTLTSLPLLPNGKVNRKALPAPDGQRPDLKAAFVEPHTQLEQTIATTWQQVLGVEKVGRDDNFFELGGHSLLLIQVHSRLQQELRQDLSILEMFKYPTIGSLAEYVSHRKNPRTSARQDVDRAGKLKEGQLRLKQQLERAGRGSKLHR